MALRGDLASVDLAQVFQMLALNKKVGLLSIQSAKLWKVLYFDQRGVSVHHNVHRVLDRVVASLVRSGRLTDAAVDEVRDHAARMAQPLTDSLLAGGYLEAAELEEQYRIELEEEIYDLFFCRDARFEFHEGVDRLEGRDGVVDERFFFNCDSVIMEAARRIDEWTYISERIPTTAEVLVATVDAIDPAAHGSDGPAIFELLDGRRNVARIVELTGLSNFQVCKVLSQLMDAGAIAPVAPEDLVPMAEQCMAEGRLQDAISLYERAIGLGMGIPDVHTLAATAYQAAEEYEHAIYHLECEAEYRVGAGDPAGAARKLLEARQLVPTDLQARERLVELTVGAGAVTLPNFDPLIEGKELVDLLIEFGDIKRVRTLLERLLLVAPDDPDLKKALVNVHIKAGDQKRVVELYESIADDLVRQNRPLEAVGYLQKILLVDRSRGDISERVRKLYEFDERTRKRSRALAALGVVFCLLAALGAGYWFYNEQAEEAFARIDVEEMVAREDFAGAASAYEEFLLHHPLTTAVAKAEGELQQIEAARQRFEARRTAERTSRDRELQKIRSDYKSEWARHRELFLAGKPEESLQCLAAVRELVAKAGAADDMAWGHEQQVERSWQRMQQFLDEAAKLASEYEKHIAAEAWERARETALRLHTEFEATKSAKAVQIPVVVRTRPAGAVLTQDGTTLERIVAGRAEPVRTPTMVLCPAGPTPVSLVARLDGFEPRPLAIDARKQAIVDVVLEVVADRRIAFPAPVQTGVGVGEGWLAVGVRGGRLGISRTNGTGTQLRELTGLKAVEGSPVVQNGRVFFLTNENSLECVPVDPASKLATWSVPLRSGAATEMTVGDGRIVLVDRNFVMHCWEQGDGRHLWSVSLDSAPSGAPTTERRQVHVGTIDGRLLTVDASDGSTIAVLRSPEPLSTRVLSARGMHYFGCADGNVRAVEAGEGRVLWTVAVGRALTDGEIALGADAVLAFDSTGQLLSIDRATGKVTAKLALDGVPQRGLRVQGSRAFVLLRRGKTKTVAAHDVLQAVQVDSLALLWEYADQGVVPGQPGIDSLAVAWPTTAGEVVLFR